MSATGAKPALLRIGDVARLVGTTPRTIRYYEEKGLLPPAEDRVAGQHRLYDAHEVERLRELLRMRNLLGVPLEELRELVAVDDERAVLGSELRRTDAPAERERILRRLDKLASVSSPRSTVARQSWTCCARRSARAGSASRTSSQGRTTDMDVVCQGGSTERPALRGFLVGLGGGGLRAGARRAVRLICAGWVPQDRGFVSEPAV